MKRLATAITWEELTALPADSVLLADVRDEVAFGHGTLPGAVRVDLADITAGRHALPRDRTIVCFCMRGVLSEEAADALTGQGWTARNLAGGYAQWLRGQMARQTADREKLDRIEASLRKNFRRELFTPFAQAVAQLKVSGNLDVNDPDALLNALPALLPVKTVLSADGIMRIEPSK